jgi:flagellar FliL protein
MALKMQDESREGDRSEEIEEEVAVGKKKPPIILIVGIIVLLALIGVGAKILISKHRHHAKPAPVVLKVGETLILDEFMMNLADDGNSHYIKTTLALGLKEGVTGEKFKDKVPQVRDAIVLVLGSKKLADLGTTQDKIALKQQIANAVNQSLGETDVVTVYYQAFATQ